MLDLQTFSHKQLKDFPSYKEWGDFIYNNFQYSKTYSVHDDWIGKCKESDLPSFHPHWRKVVCADRQISLDKKKKKLEECKTDVTKLKYYFNSSATIFSVEEDLKKEQREIDTYIDKKAPK